MAEYIDREKLLDELSESASYHAESGREYQLLLRDRNIVREQPTADVIERSEYEKLRLVNLDLAETNKGLLGEHEQLEKLRSKIDKAIEEIKDNTFEYIVFEGGYDDNEDVIRPKETTEVIRLDTLLQIFKSNIGE